jgi:Flp pilus assembly protein CpaB
MRGRRTLALVLVLVALCLLSLLIVVYLTQGDGATATPTPVADVTGIEGTPTPLIVTIAPDELQLVDVVVSIQTVPRGWQMTEAELAVESRLASEVGTNVITDIEEAIGLYARTDIFQGQTLTRDVLVGDPRIIGQESTGPSSLIPPGFEAMAIPMDRLSSVAYGLAPGDSIDVMFSLLFAELDEEFQTLLPNAGAFILVNEEGIRTVVVIDPYGRFEALANGDIAHIAPSDSPQPVPVSFIMQNAVVIQVGQWEPPGAPAVPTPTVDPSAVTSTPEGIEATLTPTPKPADVLVIALPPQQLLLLKYALEHNANVDFALRGINDGQLYQVNNVDLNYLRERFNLDIPPDFNYTIISPESTDAEDTATIGGNANDAETGETGE